MTIEIPDFVQRWVELPDSWIVGFDWSAHCAATGQADASAFISAGSMNGIKELPDEFYDWATNQDDNYGIIGFRWVEYLDGLNGPHFTTGNKETI